MAQLNRLQMVTRICDVVGKNLGAAAPSGALLQDRVVDSLNFGQKRIARHYSFYELQVINEVATTVTSVKTYPLETGTNNLGLTRVSGINSVRLIDGEYSRKLDFWHYRKFDKWYPRPENFSTGRPSIYTRWGNNLVLFKIPGDAYSLHVRYGQMPNDLVADAQTSDFQDRDQLLITVGVLETYLALQEYADVAVWYQLFLGQLTDAVRGEGDDDWEPEAEPSGAPGYISGSPWIDPYSKEDPLANYSE